MVSVSCYAASNTSIVFCTDDRPSRMFALFTPATELTSPGTWNPADFEEADLGSDVEDDEEDYWGEDLSPRSELESFTSCSAGVEKDA